MKVLILGDSHSRCFKHYKSKDVQFILTTVTGCSVQGLTNKTSRTNARQVFIDALEQNKDCDLVVCYFGEVDCNSTIWYYSEKYNIPLEQQFQRSITNYNSFLKTVESYFSKDKIIILGPILPVVANAEQYSQKAIRRNILVSQLSRTKLTNQFNKEVKNICNKNGYMFFTINKILLDKDTKIIKDEYVRNRHDHHLNKKVAAKLWKQVLPI